MEKAPLFFEPIFKERIWGGCKLEAFGYRLPFEHTGECWAISAHVNGVSNIRTGPFKGRTLIDLWRNERHLFGHPKEQEFPLLVKILDAQEDLSVQVHPDDEQAQQLEKDEAYGKSECWYVIEAEEGAELILGHTAQTKEAFVECVKKSQWDRLLRKVPIRQGDFFYVPSGTIHAIGKGAVILEIQQSSDTTYRMYDFDRIDKNGEKRELHLDQALTVSLIPHHSPDQEEKTIEQHSAGKLRRLVTTSYFTVYHSAINGMFTYRIDADYLLASVIKGEGYYDADDGVVAPVKKGDHFLIPHAVESFRMKGEMELILSHP
ncbi:mannose-6-phosphate isomerase, class I [Desmospora activa]|uniref:Mannose-6-phosphate isomerase n=1 Tax=Desmospora activa DSM 45169 TaxID=1121389 RepID=A0A2T4Z817_9BACL|nr:mannose-6-phosphate isomerase, class I [Desmospora activa]PTM58029.1 mannose-6-phosphate isomerase type 1 [Desmospora activa DSM 45169]